jgi:uncharacterized protein (TIGR03086 family)
MSDDAPARAIQAVDFLVDAVDQIPSESWDQPSNLDGWSLRDLVVHTTGSAAKIVGLAEGVSPEPAGSDPVAQLHELSSRLKTALAGAVSDSVRESLRFPIFGLTIHVWDIYRSQHRSVDVPADLLAFCREVVESVPEEDLRRPGLFGPAQPVPDDATPTDRLMAYAGRPV